MKKNIIFHLFVYVLAAFSVCVVGCRNEDAQEDADLTVEYKSQVFTLGGDTDNQAFARSVMQYDGSVKMDNLLLSEATDSQGKYKVLTGTAVKDLQKMSFAIPLTPQTTFSKSGKTAARFVVDCAMSCTTTHFCDSLSEQVIHERCARQTCACKGGGAGSSSVSFQ